MKTYKGFDKDLKCRGFQYEIGKEYEQGGEIKACENGFHACEHPLDCFNYYPLAQSRICEVEQSGNIDKDGNDTKVASSKIKIGAELNIAGIVKAAIEYTKEHSTVEKGSATGDYGASSATGYKGASSATGDCGASSATGDYGASSATGYCGASSATGYKGASSATGDYGASSATGDCGASSATGDYGASSATGFGGASSATGYKSASSAENKTAVSVAWGYESKAKGILGAHIVCAEWKYNDKKGEWTFKGAKMRKVDGVKIKADTYYSLIGGKFTEVEKCL